MADLEPSGYQTLRQCGATAWTRIGVQFEGENVFPPLPLSDPRVTQTVSDAGILYTLVLSGSDPEINASSTNTVPVDGVALFPSGDTPASESQFPVFTFVDQQDVLTINHDIRLPGGGSMLTKVVSLNGLTTYTLTDSDIGAAFRKTDHGDARITLPTGIPTPSAFLLQTARMAQQQPAIVVAPETGASLRVITDDAAVQNFTSYRMFFNSWAHLWNEGSIWWLLEGRGSFEPNV